MAYFLKTSILHKELKKQILIRYPIKSSRSSPYSIKIISLHFVQFILILLATKMKIKLYIDYISQPSRTVLAFAKISKLPVQITEIRIAKLQHLSEEFEIVNPMKKVPAIVDSQNGLTLGESHAIVAYLTRKFKLQQQWGLSDEVQRAKVEEYLHYHHQNTRKCAALLYTEVFSRLYPVDQASLPNAQVLRQEISSILTFIEKFYFKDSVYMIGKKLTVADLAAYFEIQSLVVVDFEFSSWKNVQRWMDILGRVPEIVETNHNFMRLLPKIKPKKAKL